MVGSILGLTPIRVNQKLISKKKQPFPVTPQLMGQLEFAVFDKKTR